MHVTTWLERLATTPGEPRTRLLDAFERLAADAATVLSPLPDELSLVMAGIVDATGSELDARWRARIGPVLERLDLPRSFPLPDPSMARSGHSAAFAALWTEFTSVRGSEPGATW